MPQEQLALITGISGFIAKHVALQFLKAGWAVRGTLRSLDRADEVRQALAPHLTAAALANLSFAKADLTSDEGWATAAAGAQVLVHMASPFPMAQPKDPSDLITPAVQGTQRALRFAYGAGVRRAVVTSSIVAVFDERKSGIQDEADWCDLNAKGTTAYAMSKTLAERAAWDFVTSAPDMALTCINPGLVLGAPLDKHVGTSMDLVKRLLRGRDPMLPLLGFDCVDVRDVAKMHLLAAQKPETAGKRYLATAGLMTMPDMARLLKAAHPQRRIATKVAPMWLLRVLALFDPAVKGVLPMVGQLPKLSNARARDEMAMTFTAPADALRASADWLLAHGQV